MARKSRESIEINLIPYIDILLVLVLILMLSSSLSYQAYEVELPSAAHSDWAQPSDQRHISLTQSLEVYIQQGSERQSLGQLGHLSASAWDALDRKESYTIDADARLPYQKVVDLLSALKQAGFEKVVLAMQVES